MSLLLMDPENHQFCLVEPAFESLFGFQVELQTSKPGHGRPEVAVNGRWPMQGLQFGNNSIRIQLHIMGGIRLTWQLPKRVHLENAWYHAGDTASPTCLHKCLALRPMALDHVTHWKDAVKLLALTRAILGPPYATHGLLLTPCRC